MSLRDERAAALTRRHRDLSDDFTRTLPLLLDDLDAIDRAHVPDGIIKFDIPGASPMTDEEAAAFAEKWLEASKDGPVIIMPPEPRPTDAEIGEWIRAHEDEFAAWMRKQVRIHGGDVQRAFGAVAAPGTGSVPSPGPVPPVPVSDKPPKAPPAARTAPRRRTAR